MILVDTSVWIDHLHNAEPRLVELLETDFVWCHALVIEELALADKRSLWCRGLSSVDAHLLAVGVPVLDPGGSADARVAAR